METYIEQTIQHLDQRISALQSTRNELAALFSAPSAICHLSQTKAVQQSPIKPVKPSQNKKQQKLRSCPSALQSEVLAVIHTLTPPFSGPSITIPGRTLSQIRSSLLYLAKKGVIQTITPGRPGHPATFALTNNLPPVPAPAHRVVLSSPVDRVDRAVLEKKLNDACKQRDHARENGREQMEAIFQKEIDQLESQLG